jgi:hypothetical protein
MIKKLKKSARYALVAALSLTLSMSPLAAHAAPDATIGGILVKEPGIYFPSPEIAIAPDGRSLVVWKDLGEVKGSIVSADGVTVGQPFSISGEVPIGDYMPDISVIWNQDREEWLVVFTNDIVLNQFSDQEVSFREVYAQRVSKTGALNGVLVALPKDTATLYGDRGGVRTNIKDLSNNEPRQVTASWSSIDQVYLVTWQLSASEDFLKLVGINSNLGNFGYFMTGDLKSADGINAAFVLQDRNVSPNELAKQEYSPELDQWAFIWAESANVPKIRMTTLTFGSGSFVVNASVEIVDPTVPPLNYLTWEDAHMVGDIVWVKSQGAWVVSWAGKTSPSADWNGFARTIAPNGVLVLGDIKQVSNLGTTSRGGAIRFIESQNLVYDSTAGVIYAAATGFHEDWSHSISALWSFRADNLDPIEWQEFISPQTVAGDQSMDDSSRPQISEYNGKVALVYQNNPTGVLSQVRFHLIAPANTPPAFTSGTTGSGVSGTSSTVYQALVSDAENDALTYSIDPAVTGFSISATGAVTMMDSVAAGSYVLAVRVDDGTDYETSLVTITVAAASPPVSSPSPTPAPPLAYSGPVIFSGQSAAAGAEVTLTGEKLETVTSAMVGDVPVKIVSALAQSLTLEIPTSLAAGTHDLVLQSSYGKLTVMDGLKVVAAVVTESPVTVPADTAALVKKLSVGSFRGRIVIYSKGHEGSRLSVKVAGKWLVVPELSETWNNTDYSRTTRLVGGGRLLRLDLFIDGKFVRTQKVLTK